MNHSEQAPSCIRLRITLETTPAAVFKAITGQDELSAWWTQAKAVAEVGVVNEFYFGGNKDNPVKMQILALQAPNLVEWKCIQGRWTATGVFRFQISEDERGSVLHFSHEGWLDAGDFYQHCTAKWGFFLTVSLKNYLEKGEGVPHPYEPSI